MKITKFRVQMYRGIIDSGWVDVTPLTVCVGKNEAGKTSLLKALHKFNPFNHEPYSMHREWPRGKRLERDDNQVVCSVEFDLTEGEISELGSLITDTKVSFNSVLVTRDYAGKFEVEFPDKIFPDKIHPNDIDAVCAAFPPIPNSTGEEFQREAKALQDEAIRLAKEGKFQELEALSGIHEERLPSHPYNDEGAYKNQYIQSLKKISKKLNTSKTVQQKAHDFIISTLPTFVYMDDYRSFRGTANLDEVKHRKDQSKLTGEDETLLILMALSGLDFEKQVLAGKEKDREARQFDLSDASVTLTRKIADRWKQRAYDVEFEADGSQFFTFIKNKNDPARIRLEERSKGFQWFFSFDLLLMHETKGTFKDCVILLDEPGLHLHPDAQRDLLKRMEEYAIGNTLIYTTHLPFMIDLQHPERIRVLNETDNGIVVRDELVDSQKEAKFVLQAALGMSGLVTGFARRNLVVEGVDDYWIINELARIARQSGEVSLPSDVLITPAGGASHVAYLATLLIGQDLDVVVLLDSDAEGEKAKEHLIKQWITKYKPSNARVFDLGDCVGLQGTEFCIEDILTKEFYIDTVKEVYCQRLEIAAAEGKNFTIAGNDSVKKQVVRAFKGLDADFNKGGVAKVIRKKLLKINEMSELPSDTQQWTRALFEKISGVWKDE